MLSTNDFRVACIQHTQYRQSESECGSSSESWERGRGVGEGGGACLPEGELRRHGVEMDEGADVNALSE